MVNRDSKRSVRLVDGAIGEDGKLLEGSWGWSWNDWGCCGGIRSKLSVVGNCSRDWFPNNEN